MTAPGALADRIRALPRAQRVAFYRSLPPGLLAAVRYRHELWERPSQKLVPLEELPSIYVIRGGRRSGKTWCAVHLFNDGVLSGLYPLPRIVAATDAAVMSTVIDGASGIRKWLPEHLRPRWVAAKGYAGTLVYPAHDGPHGRLPAVEVVCCSAMKPGQAVGMGRDLTLADDPAGWVETCGEVTAGNTFRQVRVSNSEGRKPCVIVPTTKRGVSFMRRLFSGDMLGVLVQSIGDTRSNTSLSPSFIRDTIAELEADGGDWAAEELGDEDRDEAPGALWKRAWIDAHRVDAPPELARIVVAVDPAEDGKAHSDETGIVVVGLGVDGRLYVLADYTARLSADLWPSVVAYAFRRYEADAVVAELTRGGSLVKRLLGIEAPNVPVIEVHAMRGKAMRAGPLTLLYRDGQVSHVKSGPQISVSGVQQLSVSRFNPVSDRRDQMLVELARDRRRFTTLEDELCGWDPNGGKSKSPNGIDALVWGCWELRPPDAAGDWQPMAGSPSLEGRYAGADPRQAAPYQPQPARAPTRFQARRGGW